MTAIGGLTDLDVITADDLNDLAKVQAFDPIWTNLTVGNGVADGYFWQVQDLAFIVIQLQFGSTTSITGAVSVEFPATILADTANRGGANGQIFFEDVDGDDYYGVTEANSTTVYDLKVVSASGSYASASDLSATVPFTWAAGDFMVVSLWYGTPAIVGGATAYDGTALTLDSEVFAPASHTTVLVDTEIMPTPDLWFDAADTSTITTDGSNNVTAWRSKTDEAGSGDTDLVQATAANRPQSGTRTVNGLNVVDFDGSTSFMAISTPVTFSQPFAVYLVMQQDTINTSTSSDAILDAISTDTRHYIALRASGYNFSGTIVGSQVTTRPVLIKVDYFGYSPIDPAVHYGNIAYVDEYFLALASPAGSWSAMTVGRLLEGTATSYFNGVICEIVCYDREVTEDEHYAIKDYLYNKWGISNTPAQITDLTLDVADTIVTATWTAPDDKGSTITSYELQYSADGTTWSSTTTTGTFVFTDGLTNGTEYSFRVVASNQVGQGTMSDIETATPNAAIAFDASFLLPAVWYDASDTGSITESSGSVSQWNDLSGNGYHLAQATATNQPTTGTRTLNGLNALDFDGTNDYMRTAFATIDQPRTIVIAANFDTIDTSSHITDGFLSTGNDRSVVGAFNTTNWMMSGGTVLSSSTTITTGDTHAVVAFFSGSNSYLRLNGTEIASGNAGPDGMVGIIVGTRYNLDPNYCSDMVLGEVVVYDRELQANELSAIESYLATKWGT